MVYVDVKHHVYLLTHESDDDVGLHVLGCRVTHESEVYTYAYVRAETTLWYGFEFHW